MRGERGVTFGPIVGIVVIIILALIGLFAVCNENEEVEDVDGLGRIELVSHEYDDGGYYDGSEGGGQNYEDQWSNEDRNRNRGRNRGAFSPGPFDDSPVDAFNGNTICLPGSTCYSDGGRGQEPPPEGEPA